MGWQLGIDYYLASYSLFFFCLFIYVATFFIQRKHLYKFRSFLGFWGLSSLFLAGYIAYVQQAPQLDPAHLIHIKSPIKCYRGVVTGEVHKTVMGKTTKVSIYEVYTQGRWQRTRGEVKLTISRKWKGQLAYGAILLVKGAPLPMRAPPNSFMVDFDAQWKISGCFHHHHVTTLEIIDHSPPSLTASLYKVRLYLLGVLDSCFTDKQAGGVAAALLFGVRNKLDGDVRNLYIASGVMHILAVSGLHVGLLYMLLLWFFYLLGSIVGRPRQYEPLAIAFLWGYVCMIGFPSSVLRAVGMLSMMAFARWQQRDYQAENILFAMAFFLLLYNPLLLFEVGFQLSFTAVLSIIYLYPPIVSFYKPKHPSVAYWWQLTSVSLAAQLGLLPLSLYYFHFFPTYFLLGNWVMVPLTSLFIFLASSVLLLSGWTWGAGCMAFLFTKVFQFSIAYLKIIASLPLAQLGPFYFPPWLLFSLYPLLYLFYQGMQQRRFLYLVSSAFLVSCMSGGFLYDQWQKNSQQALIVYSTENDQQVIGFINGRHAMLITNQVLQSYSNVYKYNIKPGLGYMGIEEIEQYPFDSIKERQLSSQKEGLSCYKWEGYSIVVIREVKQNLPELSELDQIDLVIIYDQEVEDLSLWLTTKKIGAIVVRANTPMVEQARAYGIVCHVLEEEGDFQL